MRSGRAVRDLYRHDMKLLLRILVAIALGIGAGFVFPGWLASVFATFNAVFSSLLNFVIPLLIVGFVAPAIADIGRRAGAMLGVTVAIAYLMTFGSGMLAYFTASLTFPSLIGDTVVPAADTAGTAPVPYFQIPIEPLMSVTSSLVLAFVLGFGCAVLGQSAARLKGVIDDFRSVINLIIAKVIVPLLPIYIFGIFMSMTIEGAVGPVLMTFVRIIAVIFVLHVLVLVLQYLVAAFFSGYNPFKSLWTMLPAYVTALGTQSSAATIPVTLERTMAMGVSRDTAGFVIPLCATIHMSGSTLKIVSCAVALMLVRGHAFRCHDVCRFRGHARCDYRCRPGRSRWRNHGLARPAYKHIGLFRGRQRTDDSPLHSHGQFRHRLQHYRRRCNSPDCRPHIFKKAENASIGRGLIKHCRLLVC